MLIDDMTYIEEHTPKPALYEQLAEEAVELAHAALKYARVLRGESPTPVTELQAEIAVRQEFNDLLTVSLVTSAASQDGILVEHKLARWRERLEAANADHV